MEGLLFLIIVLIVYFFPSYIASNRKHMNRGSILAMNILLGWTGLGWVICLIWSFSANTEQNFYLRTGHWPTPQA